MQMVSPIVTMSSAFGVARRIVSRIWTLIIFLEMAISIDGVCQDHQIMNRVVPPSPNAASLGLYGEIPVDKSNGIPQISVPLYTIQVDDISVPISLSFHASSHKVGTTASWVGYGWSLNAGGTVSRSMRGAPDETGYFANIKKVLQWEQQGILNYIYSRYLPTLPTSVRDLKSYMWGIHLNGWDTQPDIFYYNFPGGSGKFMFNENEQIVQTPFQDHQLEPIDLEAVENGGSASGSMGGFLITDMGGITYRFDEAEETESIGGGAANPDTYNSAWHLSSIHSQRSGKSVSFSYSSPVTFSDVPVTSYSVTESFSNDDGFGYSAGSSSSFTQIDCLYPEVISWEGGSIHFYKSGGRHDVVKGGQKLDSVRILNRTGDWIKSYHFAYDYFPGDTQLKLLSVTALGNDGRKEPPHTFEYHEEDGLPPHDSNAQDLLGYYNDWNNADLIPTYLNLGGTTIQGANREVNTDVAKLGALRVIHYPTGGSTEFTYEPHDLYQPGTPDGYGPVHPVSKVAVAENCYEDGFLYWENGFARMGLRCKHTVKTGFTSPSFSTVYTLKITPSCGSSSPDHETSPPVIGPGDMEVSVSKVTGGDTTEVASYAVTTFENQTFTILPQSIPVNTSCVLKVQNMAQGSRLTATITYNDRTLVTPGTGASNVPESGIRISQIDHYTADGALARSIKYNYHFKGTEWSSAMSLKGNPSFQYDYVKKESLSNTVYYYVHHSSPAGLLGSLQGSHIVYREVEESETGRGSTRSYFDTFSEHPSPGPFRVAESYEPPSYAWRNGSLKQEDIYDSNKNLLRSTKHFYSYPAVGQVSGLAYGLAGDFVGESYENQFAYGLNRQYSGWVRLDSTIEKSIDGADESVVRTTYTYNNDLILPAVTSVSTSEEVERREETDYLNDRTNHVISPVTETRSYRGSRLTSKTKYTYAQYKLISEKLYANGTTETGSVTYSRHNGLKPSYVATSQGTNTQYLWGYNNTLPVAVAINSSAGQIFYEGFETSGVTDSQARAGQRSFSGDYTFIPPAGFTPAAQSVLTYWYWDVDRWKFVSKPYSGGTVQLQDGSRIDEVRIYPAGARLTTYTFREGAGVSSVTDANNVTTFFEYDASGRLIVTRDDAGHIVKTYQYHYKNQP